MIAHNVENDAPPWHEPAWVIVGEYPFPPGYFRRCAVCAAREGWPTWHRIIPPGEHVCTAHCETGRGHYVIPPSEGCDCNFNGSSHEEWCSSLGGPGPIPPAETAGGDA